MSIDFNGADQYLERASAIITTYPLSIAGWFNSDTLTVDQVIASLGQTATADSLGFAMAAGAQTGDPCWAGVYAGGAGSNAATTTAYTADTWHHIVAIFTSTTSRTCYIDGGSVGNNTTSRSPATPNRTSVGYVMAAAGGGYMNGEIAEVGFWNAVLNAAAISNLAAGVYPNQVQTGDLVSYYRLNDNTDVSDQWGSNDLTAYGSPPTGASHPTMKNLPKALIKVLLLERRNR